MDIERSVSVLTHSNVGTTAVSLPSPLVSGAQSFSVGVPMSIDEERGPSTLHSINTPSARGHDVSTGPWGGGSDSASLSVSALFPDGVHPPCLVSVLPSAAVVEAPPTGGRGTPESSPSQSVRCQGVSLSSPSAKDDAAFAVFRANLGSVPVCSRE